ncbi:TetR family transcriptional regulator [Gordonia sp. SID5947]|uniref:TetR/AcrR family transcriptional regulator n=1 Tax=Gordonia sp. SID5947 TaxID=2690315 RepID=UPI0013685FD6|nr:TetR/AcrR family transcriptional regulator [Gordonia sp. SID5947]MYR05763.1 TetR family transcriptional regulator [Gordonia sp. SID5947]
MKTTRTYIQSGRADGKVATRARILAAAQDLFLEKAFEEVTLASIAKAAGVSHQTVLNHFESKAGVVLGVTELIAEQTFEVRYQARPGDVVGAIEALVRHYEQIGDANVRWAISADRFPELAAQMDIARAGHRTWLEAMFDDRLPADPERREPVLDALHAATDVYVWKLLRRDLRRTRAETEKTMADLVAGVLEGIAS